MEPTNEVEFEKVVKASDIENWLFFQKSFAILAYYSFVFVLST